MKWWVYDFQGKQPLEMIGVKNDRQEWQIEERRKTAYRTNGWEVLWDTTSLFIRWLPRAGYLQVYIREDLIG